MQPVGTEGVIAALPDESTAYYAASQNKFAADADRFFIVRATYKTVDSTR